ncbi:hypothetical protein BDF14DRAFT_1830020 [Spinellus fusiger]|nr:hypothetical protein BDF14DRAFT_1830020 [Spinellus fusiger]
MQPQFNSSSRQLLPNKTVDVEYSDDDDGRQLWNPKKRVSRDTMTKIRHLASFDPILHTPANLSSSFKLSIEAIARILRSKYMPTPEAAKRQEKNRYQAMGERRKQLEKEYGVPNWIKEKEQRKEELERRHTEHFKRHTERFKRPDDILIPNPTRFNSSERKCYMGSPVLKDNIVASKSNPKWLIGYHKRPQKTVEEIPSAIAAIFSTVSQ